MAGRKPGVSAAELDLRVEKFVRLIVNGALTHDLHAFARNEWGVSKAQSSRYAAKARAIIKESMERDRTEYFAEHLATCHQVLKMAMKQGNANGAIGALNHLARITHLEPGR